jgi:hypothetical protein
MAIARLVVDCSDVLDGIEPAAAGVSSDGEILLAVRRPSGALEVLRWQSTWSRISIQCELANIEFVQPVPEGVLLAAANSPSSFENAAICSATGELIRRFTLGDAIEDVRTTRGGQIWVSYFDEGACGNGIGSSGLNAFDAKGARVFAYDRLAANTEAIADAYAINLGSDDVLWLYYYTEFSFVRIANGQYQVFPHGLDGGNAFAIDGSRVLLYRAADDPGRTQILKLDDSASRQRIDVLNPEGGFARPWFVRGVGKSLYLFEGRRMLMVSDW